MEVKANKNNRMLVVLVGIMSVVCLSVIGFAGMLVYKGYASESNSADDDTEKVVSIDETTNLVIDNNGKGALVNYSEIQPSYYSQTAEYFSKMVEFNKATFSIIQQTGVTDSNKQQVINSANDFIIFSKSFKVYPVTTEDDIFHREFISLKYNAEMMAEYALKYAHNKDKTYRSLHGDYYDDVMVNLSTLKEIENRYY